jgi:hypothetical protein
VAFVVLETISLCIIITRALVLAATPKKIQQPSSSFSTAVVSSLEVQMAARNTVCRQQLYLVPLLLSVLWVEMMEALLWKERDQLVSIEQAPAGRTDDTDGTNPLQMAAASSMCTTRNRILTMSLFLGAIVWQPFFAIFACRRTGYNHHHHVDTTTTTIQKKNHHHTNRNQLRIPEILAAGFGIVAVGLYVYTQLFVDPNTLPTLQQHQFRSYRGRETCTYIGKHGHLQWSIAMIEQWNIAWGKTSASSSSSSSSRVFHIGSPISSQNYVLLAATCLFTKPLHLFAGMIEFMQVLFFFQKWYFDWSFEAASVWCWSGILVHIYCLLQPYLLPYMISSSSLHQWAMGCQRNYYNNRGKNTINIPPNKKRFAWIFRPKLT